MSEREYKINIDPRILELLGPSLYTNIYYVLAELIANAYDADAKNVYIIVGDDNIIVEDDGIGMSYENGEVDKYLNVAAISRTNEEDSFTNLRRRKMGRKGVGKLAALSVSRNVVIKTISNGEKSGFVLSRVIKSNNLLDAIPEEEIVFSKVTGGNGTAVVMEEPQYKLHSTLNAIKKNLLKIFPLVNDDFQIHIVKQNEEVTIKSFDKEIIKELSTLITLGDDFKELEQFFETKFPNSTSKLLKHKDANIIDISMNNVNGEQKNYALEIKGWIGTYSSTRGRKVELTDFPDNFISIYANEKLGEFNILPVVGQNKLQEVYVVGQLHIDLFELTELPDMALSNRQGYKSDDIRYQRMLEYVRKNLLPEILKMREEYAALGKADKNDKKRKRQLRDEELFKESVDKFREETTKNATDKISKKLNVKREDAEYIRSVLSEEINSNSNEMGIKSKIDSQKKKILISQTRKDKDLADVVYEMLKFNNVPSEDIIYTNCDDEICRIPESGGVYEYLRDFFVESYSTQKPYVIFVTSENTKTSWGALVEVGAAWITQIKHKIFNIRDFRPEHPLDDQSQWHSSSRDENKELYMGKLEADMFCQKIEYICRELGYSVKDRDSNKCKLETLIKIV